MKKRLLLSIIWLFILSANQVAALSYKDEIPVNENKIDVSSTQKSRANVLQIYVHRYQQEINNLYKSYSNESSTVMTEANKLLNKMSRVLTKVQENNIDGRYVEEITQSIVDDLKKFNEGMQIYLQQEKTRHETQIREIKAKYSPLTKQISTILDEIISQFTHSLSQKTKLSDKEKEIVKNLVILRTENNKIKNFENVTLKSEEEIQIYLKNTISQIRKTLLEIKSLSH